jgi:XTP/dITP diphosphohydrolase
VQQLLIATCNAHKTHEFAEILGEEFEASDLSSVTGASQIEETGRTFEENAILKAVTVSQDRSALGRFVVADDSGLEVDALEGAPGIYSARYAGDEASDQANVEKLLRELTRHAPTTQRTARFRCVIALARDGKSLGTFEGIVEGVIVDLARGANGFGYDPIFVPQGFDKTFAELSAEAKNKISHRAKAIAKLREALLSNRYCD